MHPYMSSNWRVSKASETLSGVFNRESGIYVYIYVTGTMKRDHFTGTKKNEILTLNSYNAYPQASSNKIVTGYLRRLLRYSLFSSTRRRQTLN